MKNGRPEAGKQVGTSSQEQVEIHFKSNFLSSEELQALPVLPEGRREVKGNQNRETGIVEKQVEPCWNISRYTFFFPHH